ncbi:MAG: DUF177 domain-containing protein [Ardenticatenales bacterium]|jgi:uncharacterized protein|nr:DUF177 domain-containing protein [Ardenticatenales bacterium]
MRYIVADLLMRPTGASRFVDLAEPFELSDASATLVAPVSGRLRFVRDHAGVLVQGHLSTKVEMECARCLAPTTVAVDFELVEHFRPTIQLPEGPPILTDPDEEDEPATEIDAHHVLDLSAVIEQNMLLNIPLHPLCRADCLGLCPTCGHDQNEGRCSCEAPTDPRWDALRAMLASPNGAGETNR